MHVKEIENLGHDSGDLKAGMAILARTGSNLTDLPTTISVSCGHELREIHQPVSIGIWKLMNLHCWEPLTGKDW
jgi:hypothetical protein